MSYFEALEDGVKMKKRHDGGTAYYPPCQYCGTGVYSWSYRREMRYVCRQCKLKLKAKKKKCAHNFT